MTEARGGDTEGAAPGAGRRIILDCCALLNLYASRRISEILRALPRPSAVAEIVRDREALWVGRHRSGPAADHERVNLGPLVDTGLVEVLTLDGDEEAAHFVALAASASLDDGEAMSGAIAHARNLVVATDDRAALSAFARHAPPIPVCSTASLVKHWAEAAKVNSTELRATLVDIRERAYFEPSARDPLHAWWHAAVASS